MFVKQNGTKNLLVTEIIHACINSVCLTFVLFCAVQITLKGTSVLSSGQISRIIHYCNSKRVYCIPPVSVEDIVKVQDVVSDYTNIAHI